MKEPVIGHVLLSMDAVEVAEAGINSLERLRNLELACSFEWEFLLQADVPIISGTDAPIYLLTPGFSLHEKLAVLVEFGVPPVQAKVSMQSGWRIKP